MATTPNYGFVMPDSTDLVKDLPADFATFGNAVDGQMYTNANAAIAKTLIDAKGDLIVGSAADTAARLAVGTNDYVLTADSTATNGIAWKTVSASAMTLLSTTTLSGASTNITSISGSYNTLYIVVDGVTFASAGYPVIAPNGSTNITQFAGVDYSGTRGEFANYIRLSYIAWNASNTNNCSIIQIDNYASSTKVKGFMAYGTYYQNSGATQQGYMWGGGINTTSAITSLEFSPAGGNFTAGTVKIYGVK